MRNHNSTAMFEFLIIKWTFGFTLFGIAAVFIMKIIQLLYRFASVKWLAFQAYMHSGTVAQDIISTLWKAVTGQ